MQVSEFQKRLKEETAQLHRDAENHPVMQSFVKGDFKKEHLLRFLVNVKPCYDVVEQRLLQPFIIKHSDLKRTDKIQKDIEHLASEMITEDVLVSETKTEKIGDILTPYECTDLWVAWCWAKPKEMLKAELYVRWFADLFGGRIMAKSMGEYVNAILFNDPARAIFDIRYILDTPNVVTTEDEIIDDALKFFDYHLELFTAIENE
jgi:heme oxygenase